MSLDDKNWPQTVLTFWYGELTKKDWFMSTPELDETITNRFSALHGELCALHGEPSLLPDELPALENLPSNPDQAKAEALASVIVLDQFSRNMHRGSDKAFACDPLALRLTKQAITNKLDANMTNDEKQFLYMPFIHSEVLADQQRCLIYYIELDLEVPSRDHLELIERFGRFPHRNEVLGRTSTAEEIEYLKNGKRFGQ